MTAADRSIIEWRPRPYGLACELPNDASSPKSRAWQSVYGSSGWLTDRNQPRSCGSKKVTNFCRPSGIASMSNTLVDGLEPSGIEAGCAMTDRGHYHPTSDQSLFEACRMSGSLSLRAQLAGRAEPESSLSASRSLSLGRDIPKTSAISPWLAQASREDIAKLFPSLVAEYSVPQARERILASPPTYDRGRTRLVPSPVG